MEVVAHLPGVGEEVIPVEPTDTVASLLAAVAAVFCLDPAALELRPDGACTAAAAVAFDSTDADTPCAAALGGATCVVVAPRSASTPAGVRTRLERAYGVPADAAHTHVARLFRAECARALASTPTGDAQLLRLLSHRLAFAGAAPLCEAVRAAAAAAHGCAELLDAVLGFLQELPGGGDAHLVCPDDDGCPPLAVAAIKAGVPAAQWLLRRLAAVRGGGALAALLNERDGCGNTPLVHAARGMLDGQDAVDLYRELSGASSSCSSASSDSSSAPSSPRSPCGGAAVAAPPSSVPRQLSALTLQYFIDSSPAAVVAPSAAVGFGGWGGGGGGWQAGVVEMCTLLVSHGADANVKNNAGCSAKMYAVQAGCDALVAALV